MIGAPMDAEAAGGNGRTMGIALPARIAVGKRILVDDRTRRHQCDVGEEGAAIVGGSDFRERQRVIAATGGDREAELLEAVGTGRDGAAGDQRAVPVHLDAGIKAGRLGDIEAQRVALAADQVGQRLADGHVAGRSVEIDHPAAALGIGHIPVCRIALEPDAGDGPAINRSDRGLAAPVHRCAEAGVVGELAVGDQIDRADGRRR